MDTELDGGELVLPRTAFIPSQGGFAVLSRRSLFIDEAQPVLVLRCLVSIIECRVEWPGCENRMIIIVEK